MAMAGSTMDKFYTAAKEKMKIMKSSIGRLTGDGWMYAPCVSLDWEESSAQRRN